MDWAAEAEAALRAMPNVRIMKRTSVTGAYDGGTYSALERVGLHLPARADLPRECFWRIVAARTVLAAVPGTPSPSPERTPGIMLASRCQLPPVTAW